MWGRHLLGGLVAALAIAAPAAAKRAIALDDDISGGGSIRLPPYLQCVPYARQVSGIRIYGDAHTWWTQAAGKYERGYVPRVGAVMAFRPHGKMVLGHVAAVSRIIDSRTVLIRHSNWSPINGRRGQIENDVEAVDVSPNNDWSEVRVWFDPIQALGGTHWPVQGFIYPTGSRRLDQGFQLARYERTREPRFPTAVQVSSRSSDPIGDIIAGRSRSILAYRD
jgi:surface antigen